VSVMKCRESIGRVCCAVGLKTAGKKSRKVFAQFPAAVTGRDVRNRIF